MRQPIPAPRNGQTVQLRLQQYLDSLVLLIYSMLARSRMKLIWRLHSVTELDISQDLDCRSQPWNRQ